MSMQGVQGEDRSKLTRSESAQIRRRSFALLLDIVKPHRRRFTATMIAAGAGGAGTLESTGVSMIGSPTRTPNVGPVSAKAARLASRKSAMTRDRGTHCRIRRNIFISR